MQLRRLEVTNIRSFESGRLDLGPGTTLIVGDVGAGKSSLLYAVEMALFGVAEVDAAFLVRHGTLHAEVGVTLADGEHTHAVRRRFRKVRRRGRETYEPERLTYAEDGRPTAYSATEIRQRVITLLGFPDNPNPHAHSDLWRWAIYVPQERMREILAADPEERLETVRKALGVERFRTAAENAELLARDLRVGARQRREEAARMAHWDTEFAEATRESDRLRTDRVGLADSVSGAQRALDVARSARREQEGALSRVEADRREMEGLRRAETDDLRSLDGAARREAAISSELAENLRERDRLAPVAGELAGHRARRADSEERVRALRSELDQHAGELRELARTVAALEAAERRAVEAGARAERARSARNAAAAAAATLAEQGPVREPPSPTDRSLAEIDGALSTAQADEHEAVERSAQSRAALAEIDELLKAGVCPTCHQVVRPDQFSAHRDEVARRAAESERLRLDRAGDRERVGEERKARERWERAHERWADLEARRNDAAAAVSRGETELAEASRNVEAATSEAAAARLAVDRLRPVEREEARRRELLAEAETGLQRSVEAEQRSVVADERLRALGTVVGQLTAEQARLGTETSVVHARRQDRDGRLRSLAEALARGEGAAAALAEARSVEAKAERELTEARGALVRLDTRLDSLVDRVAASERGRAERAGLVAEATGLEDRAAWVGEPFRLAVLRMEKELLAHAQSAFDRAFSRFFATLIDDPTLVARTDVSFTPEVTIGGEVTPAEALSGGERTSLALAFRLALASVVRSLGAVRLESLLLDEPTDGFSSEQVVRMGELLEELALPQVVVVSHETQLSGIADRTVRVVKVDGRSSIDEDRADGRAADDQAEAPGPASPDRSRPGR